MGQLTMRCERIPEEILLPDGYHYTTFTDAHADKTAWLEICRRGLLPSDAPDDSFEQACAPFPALCPERDTLFVENEDGLKLATITFFLTSEDGGYLHMICARPEARGSGAVPAMLTHAMKSLLARGARYIYLTTDDFRLPAIRRYLHTGFLPVLPHDAREEMLTRWEAVFDALGERAPYLND